MPGVIVVGAGPAGVAAADAVIARGLPCEVLEARQPGKDKPCGDAFVAAAMKQLAPFDFTEVDFAGMGRRFAGIDLRVDGDHILRLDDPDDAGWILPRRLIDQALRDRLPQAARISYGARVLEVVPAGEGIRVVWSAGGDLRVAVAAGVVIANGAQSRLSRALAIDGAPVQGMSISAYVNLRIDEPWFDFSDAAPLGYSWGFPVGATTANVGVCRLGPGTRRDLELGMQQLEVRLPGKAPLSWRGGGGPMYSGKFSFRHDARGVVSCGDAAGTVDPLTGEGITAALTTGRAAGDALARFLHGERTALDAYSHETASSLNRIYDTHSSRALWPLLAEVTAPRPAGVA
jgi:flavin-dependent dehydrogenase